MARVECVRVRASVCTNLIFFVRSVWYSFVLNFLCGPNFIVEKVKSAGNIVEALVHSRRCFPYCSSHGDFMSRRLSELRSCGDIFEFFTSQESLTWFLWFLNFTVCRPCASHRGLILSTCAPIVCSLTRLLRTPRNVCDRNREVIRFFGIWT